jgi:hypothetical protein
LKNPEKILRTKKIMRTFQEKIKICKSREKRIKYRKQKECSRSKNINLKEKVPYTVRREHSTTNIAKGDNKILRKTF